VLESTDTFNTTDGANNGTTAATVNTVALQQDGKILLGGNFDRIGLHTFKRIARLVNDGATSHLSVEGNETAHWFLGGAAPDITHVRFELNIGGGWTDLGPGIRTGGGWGMGGLTLPVGSSLRAIGRTTANTGNPGMILQSRVITAPVDMWRDQQFGPDALNPTIGGSLADPDGDGSVNLMEYARGTDPRIHNPEPPIAVAFEGAAITFTYQRALAATDVTYGVQTSPDAVNWDDTTNYTEEILSNDGVVEKVKVSVPFDAENLTPEKGFIRGKVSVP
jgi:hypothetical protein